MEREDNSDPIPIDIILEILSRSSIKSIARFGLASKFCASILSRPDITKLFSARSSTRPRLLFAVQKSSKWHLYSAPQPQNPDENHSLVVAADFHMQLPGNMAPENSCGPVSSLLYFPNMKSDELPVICNPSTGQYLRLPQRRWRSFLGYDPIGKQYKVLTVCNSFGHILTLETGQMSWRKIQFPHHYPISEGICINGVLYYMAAKRFERVRKIASFNVRYENVSFLKADSTTDIITSLYLPTKLINYMGNFGVITWRWYAQAGISHLGLCLWVLWNDHCNQKWLKYEYTFPADITDDQGFVSVVGVTSTGEIILCMHYTSKPFFVFYFNPERKTLEKVEIQGFEDSKNRSRVYTFVDYTEDLRFI